MVMNYIFTSPIPWIWFSVILIILIIILMGVLILLKIFTHGFVELKAKLTGKPICMFFEDSRYCNWKVIQPESGLVQDKNYGSFLVNEQGSYIDRQTKNVFLPFDAGFATGASVKAFKMSDNLWKIFKDESKLNMIRKALLEGKLDKNELEGLRESVNFSHLRSLSNTILPHNITAKIEMSIAQRLQGMQQVNWFAAVVFFVSILGAIIMGAVLLRMYG